jgi:hypothetical protein
MPGARAVFKQLIEDLETAGIPVGSCDRLIVRMLAEAVAGVQQARKEAETLRGMPKVTKYGLQAIGRMEKLAVAHQKTIISCCDRLGLSPKARESITIERPDNSMADIMELLTRPRVRKAPPTM